MVIKAEVSDEEYLIPIGKADIKRTGADVTLVSFGKILKEALKAADSLMKSKEIDVEVIDLRTVRPLDYQSVYHSVKKTNRLVILEEAWPFGSVASELTFKVQREMFDYLDAPIARVTCADTPSPYSSALFDHWLPNDEKVKDAILKVMYA